MVLDLSRGHRHRVDYRGTGAGARRPRFAVDTGARGANERRGSEGAAAVQGAAVRSPRRSTRSRAAGGRRPARLRRCGHVRTARRVDAAECGPTFGVEPGASWRSSVARPSGRKAGGGRLRRRRRRHRGRERGRGGRGGRDLGERTTPYTLAAAGGRAGAPAPLAVGVVCAPLDPADMVETRRRRPSSGPRCSQARPGSRPGRRRS